MDIFLDTSVLVKLYSEEADSYIYDNLFKLNKINTIFLSEITKIEFESALWKKSRKQLLTLDDLKIVTQKFEEDYKNFTFINTNKGVLKLAKKLFSIYGSQGLRSLDSIQLATCIKLKNEAILFLTADTLLKTFLIAEGLNTTIPTT